MIWIFRKILLPVFCFLILAFLSLLLFFKTPKGARWIENKIQQELAKEEISITFSRLSGWIPLVFHFENVRIENKDWNVEAKSLSFSLNITTFFGKTISLQNLQGEGIFYQTTGEREQKKTATKPSFSLLIDRFSFKDICMEENSFLFSARGSLSLKENFSSILANVELKKGNSRMKILINSAKDAIGSISASLHYREVGSTIKNSSFYSDFFFQDEALQRLLFSPEEDPLPLKGRICGSGVYSARSEIEKLLGNTFSIDGELLFFSDRSFLTKGLTLSSKKATATCSASFAKNFQFQKVRASLQELSLDKASFLEKGTLRLVASLENKENRLFAKSTLFLKDVGSYGYFIEKCSFDYEGEKVGNQLLGSMKIEGRAEGEGIEGLLDLSLGGEDIANIETGSLLSFLGQANGNLRIRKDALLEGIVELQSKRLQRKIEGKTLETAGVFSCFFHGEKEQAISLEGNLLHFFFEELTARSIIFTGEASSLANPDLEIDIQAFDVSIADALFERLHLSTTNEQENYPFLFEGEGDFSFQTTGFWHLQEKELLATVQSLRGFFGRQSFILEAPFSFEKTPGKTLLTPLTIATSEGFFFAELDTREKSKKIAIHFTNLPLDLLSLNPYSIPASGTGSLDLAFEEEEGKATGAFTLDIAELTLSPEETTDNYLRGKLTASLGKEASFTAFLTNDIEELFDAKGTLSLEASFYNLTLSFQEEKPLVASLFYDGKIESILDFLDTKANRFKGPLYCDVTCKGTLRSPIFEGDILLKEGSYENYYTGQYFTDISISGRGENSFLVFPSITGYDDSGGSFSGNAKFSLSKRQLFAFDATIKINDLILVDIPIALASADGEISIIGSAKKAKARGKIRVIEARFSIPDSLPPKVPVIPLENIRSSTTQKKEKTNYPIFLDIAISSKRQIYIDGKGLSSRWQGDFLLQGTYDNIKAKGDLTLAQGNFVFAGRSFDLTEGLFRFQKEEKIPSFSVRAVTSVLGTNITASFRGTLERPKLSFTSSPSLPISSILSLLIFGQDISELTVFQTASLAAAAASFSGTGPDIFQSTKTALGIDRLAVVHTPGAKQNEGETGPETSALQVGKYVVDGVLVTVSQGLEESSSNVGVQIDLRKGFIFEAETIRQQEQGKFGIRWNYNY